MEYLIASIKLISSTAMECRFADGTAFFLRGEYLRHTDVAALCAGGTLDQQQFDDCVQAGLAYSAERCAMGYLNRSEHSRAQLQTKLLKKGHGKEFVTTALDYLETVGFLDDSRFARSWLRNRAISHTEGRARLLRELVQRGIDRETAAAAIDDFFTATSEDAQLAKAWEKLSRRGKSAEEMQRALVRLGFSPRDVHRFLQTRADG